MFRLFVVGMMVLSAYRTHAQDCTLTIPNNPLTSAGLATPYILSGSGCDQTNTGSAAFVQAAIINTRNGDISIYNPLVINKGTSAAIVPTPPTLPSRNVVAIWFGFNGNTLTLANPTGLTNGNCVNGDTGSIFGQFAYCNAPAFFSAASTAIQNGRLDVPDVGCANDGNACPTVRDFMVVDQDQSDNLQTTYLISANNQLAQNTAANRAALKGAQVLSNGSDNRLLDTFILPAMGCSSWQAPDLADSGSNVNALALNEIQAMVFQESPEALIPSNDPMAQVNGQSSLNELNLYRAGVNQPQAASLFDASAKRYCNNFVNTGAARIQQNQRRLGRSASPDPAMNLFQFLSDRFNAAFGLLNCQNFGLNSPLSTAVMIQEAGESSPQGIVSSNFATIGLVVGCTVLVGAFSAFTVLFVRRQRQQKSLQQESLTSGNREVQVEFLNANEVLKA